MSNSICKIALSSKKEIVTASMKHKRKAAAEKNSEKEPASSKKKSKLFAPQLNCQYYVPIDTLNRFELIAFQYPPTLLGNDIMVVGFYAFNSMQSYFMYLYGIEHSLLILLTLGTTFMRVQGYFNYIQAY